MLKIFYSREPPQEIASDKPCRVTKYGNHMEVTALERKPSAFHTRRISNREYVNVETGEIREYKTPVNHQPSSDSLRKTFKRLELLIKGNFIGGKSEVFLSLGYDGEKATTEQLQHDLKLFWRKVRRKFPTIEYISVCEYTQSGLLHVHIFVKNSDGKRLSFDRNWLIEVWGHESVYVQRISTRKDVERLSAYVNPFSNPEKRQRLHFYPSGIRHYRYSKGIKQPLIANMTYAESVKMAEAENFKIKDSKTFCIIGKSADGAAMNLNRMTKNLYLKERNF